MKVSITKRITFSVNSAPAVRYPVGRSSFQGRFLLVSGVVGLMIGGLWIHTVAAIGGAQLVYFVGFSVVLAMAGYAWRHTDTGFLAWGGESWVWTTGSLSTTGSMVIHFDIQSLMVATLTDEQGRSVWLWLEQTSDPVCWRALRRAIYADKQAGAVAGGFNEDVKTEVSL